MNDPKYMDIDFICPECEARDTANVRLEVTMMDIIEQIADGLICPECGTPCKVTGISLTDINDTINLPMYRGPHY